MTHLVCKESTGVVFFEISKGVLLLLFTVVLLLFSWLSAPGCWNVCCPISFSVRPFRRAAGGSPRKSCFNSTTSLVADTPLHGPPVMGAGTLTLFDSKEVDGGGEDACEDGGICAGCGSCWDGGSCTERFVDGPTSAQSDVT